MPHNLGMLQKLASGIHATLKASTYGHERARPFARCGLAGGIFCQLPGFYYATSGPAKGFRGLLTFWESCNNLKLSQE
jgi:hypothetical protein